ncbi:hypothetical protein [Pelagibacterium lentulum]|uniref:Uncharacterized protein n=1 Tax=Pelagibacterium lentulum TaxID=2029865 RepID=A0A916RE32_9HYPH|nr:hypothetical protein [Pelagibacterium lentulum]GGA53865.1 hypothetical protein GCM10011499_24970 [Pelagibacterium lentulum]
MATQKSINRALGQTAVGVVISLFLAAKTAMIWGWMPALAVLVVGVLIAAVVFSRL